MGFDSDDSIGRLDQRVEGRHPDHRTRAREGEPLDGRDADPQAGERARPDDNAVEVDVSDASLVAGQAVQDVSRQAGRVGSRRIAREQFHHAAIAHQRQASATRRRIERKNQHRSDALL